MGFSFRFTDISKQITEEHYFSDEAPSYRIVTRGINIYGICKFKKCCAYNEEVIVPLENVEFFGKRGKIFTLQRFSPHFTPVSPYLPKSETMKKYISKYIFSLSEIGWNRVEQGWNGVIIFAGWKFSRFSTDSISQERAAVLKLKELADKGDDNAIKYLSFEVENIKFINNLLNKK